MPKAPSPITSPPPVPGQPYSASAAGSNDQDQTASEHVYDAAGGPGAAEPWVKVQDGGHANPDGSVQSGAWPGNGASSDGGWGQT